MYTSNTLKKVKFLNQEEHKKIFSTSRTGSNKTKKKCVNGICNSHWDVKSY